MVPGPESSAGNITAEIGKTRLACNLLVARGIISLDQLNQLYEVLFPGTKPTDLPGENVLGESGFSPDPKGFARADFLLQLSVLLREGVINQDQVDRAQQITGIAYTTRQEQFI